MRIALYQPDIPQNTGALLRLGACLGVGVDVIEPCGFIFSTRKMARAGMDYIDHVELRRHASWQAFCASRGEEPRRREGTGRLILLSTRAAVPYTDFEFAPTDTLLLGRESAGVPDAVHDAVDSAILIPMRPGMRSINVAQSCAMVLGEALRQTRSFPAADGARP
ncbi:tRNA (cytidine(34)-2'-O)-methyltransferase [Varunaivibrio sulfuroxidans]|uniref:tRNA (cytidine(34)-2'-O)-methyltransferase n=1 Tax=Varunaivibrio sulfuroxidans TaxID=1773489 RepID=A0A4R3J530_9PROT|nr:tRNA (cytidine(34)-2'-O)-methyltransferase [Varunaivibrio sulfuroxidans]TCS60918.1 tRNA (cytidine/uridine-2'-O-)-methyltransferase [Varunaivibrio sulfuroxidans]WES31674.1 tRNA (cytidine(34)-2'-O)-methyltransferase [Varunaivibrio sulfuroxidans]